MKVRAVVSILLLLGIALTCPLTVGSWMKQTVEKRLEFEIKGRLAPLLSWSSFELRDAQVEWEDKIRVTSGDVKISYDLFSLLSPKGMRIQISSTNLKGRLLDDWIRLKSDPEVDFETVFADLKIGQQGIQEILSLDIQAQELQLKIEHTTRS